MGAIRKVGGRIRRMLVGALGGEVPPRRPLLQAPKPATKKAAAAPAPAAAKDKSSPVLTLLQSMLMDGDYATFNKAWSHASAGGNDPSLQERLLALRAEAQLAEGDHSGARETAQALINRHDSPLGRYFLGQSHFLLGEYEHCITSLQACLYAMPTQADAAYLLADAAVLIGQPETAWRTLEQLARVLAPRAHLAGDGQPGDRPVRLHAHDGCAAVRA